MASYVVPKPTEKPIKIFQGGGLQPPKFMPSYYEWLSIKGQQVFWASNVSATFATVPADQILFITSAYINIYCVAALTNDASLGIQDATTINNLKEIIRVKYGSADTQVSSSNSFPIPIKVLGTERISFFHAGAGGSAGFTGFLVKKSDLPQI